MKSMPKSVPAVCSTCRYWAKDPESQNKRTGEYEQGQCYRHPPTVHLVGEDGAIYTRPVTGWRDFCGDFKVRQDA